MADPTTKTELLKSHENELVKQYIAFDASDRAEYVYTAVVDAAHGDSCLVTRYGYDGVSSRIEKRKEYYSTWDSSYDI